MANIGYDIAKYMNEVNWSMFTDEEVCKYAADYNYMIENNQIDSIIQTLKEEFDNSSDNKSLELINTLKNLM